LEQATSYLEKMGNDMQVNLEFEEPVKGDQIFYPECGKQNDS